MARLHSPPWNQRAKPWRAAVKIRYREHYLGSFATRAEAEAAERAFRERRGQRSAVTS